jgi:hypothetical protein
MHTQLGIREVIAKGVMEVWKGDFGKERKFTPEQVKEIVAILPDGTRISLPNDTVVDVRF